MSTGVKAHVAGSCGCKAGWFERWLSRPLIGLFPSIIYLCIGLRCRFCEVHRRHLMHGGTQTIRFWGLQHVHWCEGSCCWFLRLQSRLVWEVAIQAVDWFVPEHHLCIGLRCLFLRGSPSAFDAWWHANNPLLGATTCPLVWRLMLLVLAAAKPSNMSLHTSGYAVAPKSGLFACHHASNADSILKHFPTSSLGQYCTGSLLLNFGGWKRYGAFRRIWPSAALGKLLKLTNQAICISRCRNRCSFAL